MIQLLSHATVAGGPNWPGSPGFAIRTAHEIAAGRLANTSVIEVYSHYGTHVDAPYHFIPGGRRLDQLPLESFVFDRPRIVELPLRDRQLIRSGDLAPKRAELEGADLLLFRSGFEAHREDRHRYEEEGPGFSGEAARWIRSQLPSVRGVAMDWLSLCAYSAVDEGADAHRILLADAPSGHPVLVFEDVRLSALTFEPRRVLALPWLTAALDGSPCTIVAES